MFTYLYLSVLPKTLEAAEYFHLPQMPATSNHRQAFSPPFPYVNFLPHTPKCP